MEPVMIADDRIWLKSYDSWVPADISIPDITYLELLERAFDEFPTKTACRFLDTSLSFHDLDRFSRCFASFLSQSGYRPGDVVAINLPNTPQFLIAHTGALRANCLPTGLSPLLSSREMVYQLNDCRARLLVTVESMLADKFLKIQHQVPNLIHVIACNLADFATGDTTPSPKMVGRSGDMFLKFMDILQDFKPQRLLHKAKPRDVCLIQYTGGTTGPPKGTMLTHQNVVANILQCNQWLKVQRGLEVYLPAFPFSHLAGLALGMTAMGMGHTQIIIPNPRDTRHICNEIACHRPTIMAFVPSLYRMLLQDSKFKTLDFSSCRICLSGAAPLAPELLAEVESVVGKKKVVEVYGLTETFILTMNPYQGKKKTGSVGIPLQSTRIKIVDLENGKQEIPIGEEGELIAQGPQIMNGYCNLPEVTGRTLRKFEKQKWIFTGDVARMDEDGYLNIVDRLKDMIIVGGFKVFSREVEEVLSEHPAVAFGAVVGVPNPERPGSELVKAIIQLTAEYGNMSPHALEGELTAYFRENLAPYKIPKIMEFVEEVPLTAVGKVDKKLLKPSRVG
jgi:acyl-CoA synthetase (AMP-forming)/AMP-acid ligase II